MRPNRVESVTRPRPQKKWSRELPHYQIQPVFLIVCLLACLFWFYFRRNIIALFSHTNWIMLSTLYNVPKGVQRCPSTISLCFTYFTTSLHQRSISKSASSKWHTLKHEDKFFLWVPSPVLTFAATSLQPTCYKSKNWGVIIGSIVSRKAGQSIHLIVNDVWLQCEEWMESNRQCKIRSLH